MPKKEKNKPTPIDPQTAIMIFQGALENLKAAGIRVFMGWDLELRPMVVLLKPAYLCPECGGWSAAEWCQHCDGEKVVPS